MTKKSNVPREKKLTTEQQQLKKIGRAFRNGRLDQSLKFYNVQQQSGVSSVTISKIEKGDLDNCSLQTLNKIADVLGLKIIITVEPKNGIPLEEE